MPDLRVLAAATLSLALMAATPAPAAPLDQAAEAVVKLTLAKRAALRDPSGLFNSSLEGNVRRAIDIHEGEKIDEKALQALIHAAVELNVASAGRRSRN